MSDLITQPAEISFTLEITRAATGETETVEMIGYINSNLEQDNENVSNS